MAPTAVLLLLLLLLLPWRSRPEGTTAVRRWRTRTLKGRGHAARPWSTGRSWASCLVPCDALLGSYSRFGRRRQSRNSQNGLNVPMLASRIYYMGINMQVSLKKSKGTSKKNSSSGKKQARSKDAWDKSRMMDREWRYPSCNGSTKMNIKLYLALW